MDNCALWFFKGPFLVLSPSVKGICVEHDAIVYRVCYVELGATIWGPFWVWGPMKGLVWQCPSHHFVEIFKGGT